jgi:N-acetylmuramoyl-L-alanine amidase
LLALPAVASDLQFWRFNPGENRLIFTTDSAVQPRAQLIPNPTRLVIDLPGVVLGSPMMSQNPGGAVREVRVAQFDPQTTRIVIEMEAGYTIDPQQVQVLGSTPTQWIVQLPMPQAIAPSSTATSTPQPISPTPTPTSPAAPPVAVSAPTQLEGIRATGDGFFLRFRGMPPELEQERSRDGRQIILTLPNAGLSTQFTERDQIPGRHGVNRIRAIQTETSPPTVQVLIDLVEADLNFQASVSNLGGIVVVPTGGDGPIIASAQEPEERSPTPPPASDTTIPATIQAVELSGDGSQLLIQSDRPVSYSSGWDRRSGAYQIRIPSSRLAARVSGPELNDGSPLLSVRLREEEDQSVAVQIMPAAGVRIGDINQPGGQLLALQLQRTSQTIPVTPPAGQPPATATPPSNLPRVPNGRIVVVIDPGHGGPDPGAVGIGGLSEIDIVLPVGRQVAALLQQQGIEAVLTRDREIDLDLEPRVQIAERVRANLFVSIHANAISLSRPDVNGIETYYLSDRGLQVARVLHAHMLQVPGTRDRGIRQANFYVLRNTSMPAVLLELGFVTGEHDARLLADPAFQTQMANAIARGILQYVQQNY